MGEDIQALRREIRLSEGRLAALRNRRKRWVVESWRKGVSAVSIAAASGLSAPRVYQLLQRLRGA